MIEIAEAYALSQQLDQLFKNKKITSVEVLNKPHKFCWLNHEVNVYKEKLENHMITSVKSLAHFIVITFDTGNELACSEDVNFIYHENCISSKNQQLLMTFNSGDQLELKVKLYGFMLLGEHDHLMEESPYYKVAQEAISPLSQSFTFDYFMKVSELDQKKGSVKEALATKQHIPGLGNGTLQDILFDAMISPKRKVNTLEKDDHEKLYHSVKKIIIKMIDQGGRDIVLDAHGNPGGYETLMHSKRENCPRCSEKLIKESYLGGKVIYCPSCQK